MAVVENTQNNEIHYRVYPDIYRRINHEEKTIEMEVSLPGTKKEDIKLKALPTWFHLEANRGKMQYSANQGWGYEIMPENTTAKYENGLLRIHATIRDPLEDAKVVAL